MAVPTVVNIKYAVFINGVQVQIAAGPVINEALGNLCRVCEFELAEQPEAEPQMDDTILVQLLDYTNEVTYDLFGGTTSALDTDSEPWSYVIQSTDQLERLRRAPQNDHVYTGMTVTEAMQDILDSCNIDYDLADLVDIDYVLGDKVKISWPAEVAGSDMVTSFNDVFGTVLQTIGNDRVIWFLPELPPTSGTGKYRDFEKGVNADWPTHHRQRGTRDNIQNLWDVRGASWPCGSGDPPECTCQPWAKSIHGNSQLGGRRIRTVTQSITSDLIQDESLAEYVVRRQMRLTNRIPDTAVVDTLNDTNIHPGTKIGLIDHTYGINTEALRLCTTTSVDRNGNDMTLNLICGTPGNEGTVTHGVEKVCNDTHSDIDVPGGFDPPDFDVPDLDIGIDLDPLDFDFDFDITVIGGTNPPVGGGSGSCFVPVGSDWDDQGFSLTFGSGSAQFNDGSEGPEILLIDPATIDYSDRVSWHTHVEFSGPGNGTTDVPIGSLGLRQTGANETARVTWEWDSASGLGFIYLYGFDAGFHQEDVTAADIHGGFDLDIIWNPTADTISYILDNGSTVYENSVILNAIPGDAVFGRMAFASASALSMTTTDHDICIGGGLILSGGDWVTDSGSGTYGDGSASLSGTSSAHNEAASREVTEDWRLIGRIIPGGDEATFGMGADGLSFNFVVTLYNGGPVEISTLEESITNGTDMTGQSYVDIILDFDSGTDTVTATFNPSSGPNVVLSAWANSSGNPYPTLYPMVRRWTTGGDFERIELI